MRFKIHPYTSTPFDVTQNEQRSVKFASFHPLRPRGLTALQRNRRARPRLRLINGIILCIIFNCAFAIASLLIIILHLFIPAYRVSRYIASDRL